MIFSGDTLTCLLRIPFDVIKEGILNCDDEISDTPVTRSFFRDGVAKSGSLSD